MPKIMRTSDAELIKLILDRPLVRVGDEEVDHMVQLIACRRANIDMLPMEVWGAAIELIELATPHLLHAVHFIYINVPHEVLTFTKHDNPWAHDDWFMLAEAVRQGRHYILTPDMRERMPELVGMYPHYFSC